VPQVLSFLPDRLDPSERLIPGGPGGCLLLHGFSGSPLEMLPLAEALAEEGWTVSVARLAGHGTSPRDLAGMRWEEWFDSARAAFRALADRCERVAVIGLSMGGALGLLLAADEDAAAVVTISTPIRVHPLWARASLAAARVLPLAPVLFRLGPRERQMRGYLSPYTRIPLGGTHQVDRLLEATRAALPAVRSPLLVLQGRRDWVIPRESGPQIVALAGSPATMEWLPRSGHVATLDRDRLTLFQTVRDFLRPALETTGVRRED
jgi:carboxylesterase